MNEIRHFVRFREGFTHPRADDPLEQYRQTLLEPAAYMQQHLECQNIDCREPQWNDGHFVIPCAVRGRAYDVAVRHDTGGCDWFEVHYPRTLGRIGRLLGKKEHNEMMLLSSALQTALQEHREIQDIRWYRKAFAAPEKDYSRIPIR